MYRLQLLQEEQIMFVGAMKGLASFVGTLKRIYISPLSVAVLLISGAAYYYLFNYIEAASFFMLTASVYLVYVLIVTSALLLTASLYMLRKRLLRASSSTAGAPMSAVTSAFGSMMSCGCHYSLFSSFLGFIGLGAEGGTITGLDFFYSNYFIAAFIAINVILLLYIVRKA